MLNWGIASTGEMAKNMATAFNFDNKKRQLAVSSRNEDQARKFATQYGIHNSYGSFAAMLEDTKIDVVYIAGPHTTHYDYARLALKAGKNVLGEKPLTINFKQSQELANIAKNQNLFLMEAMWMRFFPAMENLKKMIKQGELGEIHFVNADFCVKPDYDLSSRLFDRKLGGGGLLDLGVYPLSLIQWILGNFDSVTGVANLGEAAVDINSVVCGKCVNNSLFTFSCGFNAWKPREAHIVGDKAEIYIPEIFFRPDRFIIRHKKKQDLELNFPFDGNGYIHEIRHVEDCISQGKIESPIMPLSDSLEILRIADQLRHQWGVIYPCEEQHLE